MKFSEARTETQVVLLGGALAGVIGAFARDEEDEGRQLLETALSQIGLTPDEFQTLMTDLPPEVESEVEAFNRLAEEDADFEEDFGDDQDDDDADDLETMEERPGNLYDNGRTDADGWETL